MAAVNEFMNYLFHNTVGHRSQVAAEEKSLPETLTTACHAASWLARS
jgi:hypothetical protein